MPDPRFRAPPPTALRCEALGGLTAVFDRRSAQTHLMAPPLPEILVAMGEGGWDAGALAARLGEMFDIGDTDPVAIVVERLTELESLGLVSRA